MLALEGFTALLDAPAHREAHVAGLGGAEPIDVLDPFDVSFELDADAQPGDAGTCEFGTP